MGNPTDDVPGQPQNGRAISFTPGDRVELTADPPGYGRYALAAGDRGIVEFADWLGTIHVHWRNGVHAGIIAELAGLLRRVAVPGDGS